jgi:hypothetical protein
LQVRTPYSTALPESHILADACIPVYLFPTLILWRVVDDLNSPQEAISDGIIDLGSLLVRGRIASLAKAHSREISEVRFPSTSCVAEGLVLGNASSGPTKSS